MFGNDRTRAEGPGQHTIGRGGSEPNGARELFGNGGGQKGQRPDRRVRRTRRALHEALIELTLEKGYDAVTVGDLLERADVGRATFYAHFRDKDDLLLSGFDGLWEELRRRLTGHSPEDVARYLFAHAGGHRAVWRALVGRRGGGLLHRRFHDALSAILSEHLGPAYERRAARPAVPLDVVVEYVASALVSMLAWWLEDGQRYGAEEMGEHFVRLTRPAVHALLEV